MSLGENVITMWMGNGEEKREEGSVVDWKEEYEYSLEVRPVSLSLSALCFYACVDVLRLSATAYRQHIFGQVGVDGTLVYVVGDVAHAFQILLQHV